jgi:hypothetical protein
MRTPLAAFVILTLALGACSDETTTPTAVYPVYATGPAFQVEVSTDADAGEGSFRAAIEAANGDASITSIRLAAELGTVSLGSTVTYTGAQALSIDGRGAVIDASGVSTALVANGGASLSLENITIQDAVGDGVLVDIPATATGEIAVELRNVTLSGHGAFGLHIDDQTSESAASIRLDVVLSRIEDNGFGIDSDRDGIRVDEGGPGDVVSLIDRSVFTGNAADGIEYDEKGPGDVRTVARNSSFDYNGAQPQDPSDLEDGFDIDEAGDGSVYAEFLNVSTSHNDDGGIDLDEEDAGDIVMWLNQVVATDNIDDNIKASEDADAEETDELDGSGGIQFRFQNVTSLRSGDNGIQLEEFGIGDVNGEVVNTVSSDNLDDGLNIEQADEGEGTVRLQTSVFEGNADKQKSLKGVTVIGG